MQIAENNNSEHELLKEENYGPAATSEKTLRIKISARYS